MKSMLLAGMLVLGSGIPLAPWTAGVAQDEDAPAPKWEEILNERLPMDMRERDLNYPAPGALAYVFWIDHIVGGAVVDRLDRKGLAVFIGIGVNSRHAEAAAEDIRVEFVDSSGRVHPVEADATAGGANCMLFRSPDGLDTMQIRRFRILRNSSVDWTKRGS